LDFLLSFTMSAIKSYPAQLFHLMKLVVNKYFTSKFLTCLVILLYLRLIPLPFSVNWLIGFFTLCDHDGSQIKVHGIGHTRPSSYVTLDFLLYIPMCPFNLISISKLPRTRNYPIPFANHFVLVQDQRTKQTIGAWHESWGLYYLSQSVACIPSVSQALEHQCLGHLSPTKMRLIFFFIGKS